MNLQVSLPEIFIADFDVGKTKTLMCSWLDQAAWSVVQRVIEAATAEATVLKDS